MKLISVLSVAMALSLPGVAAAFVPVPQAMTCMLYFRADVVFSGEVMAREAVKGKTGGADGWVYTLKVLRPYRNAKAADLKVFAGRDSGLVLAVGKQYLLFAYNEDGRLSITEDGLSGELKDATGTQGSGRDQGPWTGRRHLRPGHQACLRRQ